MSSAPGNPSHRNRRPSHVWLAWRTSVSVTAGPTKLEPPPCSIILHDRTGCVDEAGKAGDVREALTQLDPLWDELFPAE